jgi:hypothetical protein
LRRGHGVVDALGRRHLLVQGPHADEVASDAELKAHVVVHGTHLGDHHFLRNSHIG